MAQRINRVMGGVAVMPWELDVMPDEWLQAFEAISDDLPKMRSGMAQADAAFERVKARLSRKQ